MLLMLLVGKIQMVCETHLVIWINLRTLIKNLHVVDVGLNPHSHPISMLFIYKQNYLFVNKFYLIKKKTGRC